MKASLRALLDLLSKIRCALRRRPRAPLGMSEPELRSPPSACSSSSGWNATLLPPRS